MYCVFWNQAAHTFSSHYFFLFLSLQFSVYTNLSFSSDSTIAGLKSDSLTALVVTIYWLTFVICVWRSFGSLATLRLPTQDRLDCGCVGWWESLLDILVGFAVPKLKFINEPPHDKTNKMTFVLREDTYHPVHRPKVIRVRCPHEETLGPQLPIEKALCYA